MNIQAEIQSHFIQPYIKEKKDRVPDVITKLFYVNWMLEQSDDPIDSVMFLINLIEDGTKSHKEKIKILHQDMEWVFSSYTPSQESKREGKKCIRK